MIPKIEVYMHDNSVGYPRWFEIDSTDYLENTFVIVDEFGNSHEFSGKGRLFRVKTEEEKHMKFYEMQEKQQIRREMYEIIANRSILDLSPEELQEVQKLAKRISSEYIFDSKPLPKMTLETLTVKRYQELREIGYRVMDIRRALNISETKLRKWRFEQGLSI
ncbi:hypothetical protein [Enterococcus faecalis]|uniref:hypothetical protein n=1 Tax=Enterococcus faecalis TaxID=1351 RepID=UPI0003546504|nr:hypothetical protein [Enterococcus faecalis]EPI31387.1 hypothetical protein D349_01243 [Enterococcus faecalis UP2S-6]